LEKGAVAVILISSLNRGDYTAFSDADIVIVVRNDYPKKFLDRVTDFIDLTLPIDVEPRVYTENEIMRLAEEGTHIVKEITSYGILLAGDKSVIDKMISVLKRSSTSLLHR
jgi:predicted nucleotidyltransferase